MVQTALYVPKPVRAAARMASVSPPDWGEEEPVHSDPQLANHPLLARTPKAPPAMKWNPIEEDRGRRRRRSQSRSRSHRRRRRSSSARSSGNREAAPAAMVLTPAIGARSAATAAPVEERRPVMVKGKSYSYKGRGAPLPSRMHAKGQGKGKGTGKKGKHRGKGWRNQFCTATGIYT